jgi:hypothetical protein
MSSENERAVTAMTSSDRREWTAIAVFCAGATASLVWAYANVSELAAMYGASGGVGGVSAGIGIIRSIVPPIVVFWLASRVRDRGVTATRLRRAHQFITLLIAVIVVLFAVAMVMGTFRDGISGAWLGILAAALLGGALWLPVQTFFASAFVGLWIRPR